MSFTKEEMINGMKNIERYYQSEIDRSGFDLEERLKRIEEYWARQESNITKS